MDLDEHLQRIEDLMWPTLFILGGGVSKNADKFVPKLTTRTPVVAASLRNDAGIIGAAVVAAEGLADAADDLGQPAGGPAPQGRRPDLIRGLSGVSSGSFPDGADDPNPRSRS